MKSFVNSKCGSLCVSILVEIQQVFGLNTLGQGIFVVMLGLAESGFVRLEYVFGFVVIETWAFFDKVLITVARAIMLGDIGARAKFV